MSRAAHSYLSQPASRMLQSPAPWWTDGGQGTRPGRLCHDKDMASLSEESSNQRDKLFAELEDWEGKLRSLPDVLEKYLDSADNAPDFSPP